MFIEASIMIDNPRYDRYESYFRGIADLTAKQMLMSRMFRILRAPGQGQRCSGACATGGPRLVDVPCYILLCSQRQFITGGSTTNLSREN